MGLAVLVSVGNKPQASIKGAVPINPHGRVVWRVFHRASPYRVDMLAAVFAEFLGRVGFAGRYRLRSVFPRGHGFVLRLRSRPGRATHGASHVISRVTRPNRLYAFRSCTDYRNGGKPPLRQSGAVASCDACNATFAEIYALMVTHSLAGWCQNPCSEGV